MQSGRRATPILGLGIPNVPGVNLRCNQPAETSRSTQQRAAVSFGQPFLGPPSPVAAP